MIDVNTPLGELVLANPGFAPVLERYRLDFCCQGRQSLAEACQSKGVDQEQVLAELIALQSQPPEQDWSTVSLADLTKHIEQRYHSPLRSELPSLEEMARKVARVHGQNHPELRQVEAMVTILAADLLAHTAKEETVLFPWIREVELGGSRPLEAPVSVMESEHEEAGALLESLRSATHDYTPPVDACTTYRLLFSGLDRFERELHLHIHLESSVLFPRALAMAAEKVAAG